MGTGAALLVVAATTAADRPMRPGIEPHREGPPPGHTGGFGEPTCRACHAEFPLNQNAEALTVAGFPSEYVAGEKYIIEVSILGDDMVFGGFQAAVRFTDGSDRGRDAGALAALDEFVRVYRDTTKNVSYAQHTFSGAGVAHSGSAHWSFHWTAPESTDPIDLHVAANDTNGDNSPLGDFVYATFVSSTVRSSR